jgi:hypothetical protein
MPHISVLDTAAWRLRRGSPCPLRARRLGEAACCTGETAGQEGHREWWGAALSRRRPCQIPQSQRTSDPQRGAEGSRAVVRAAGAQQRHRASPHEPAPSSPAASAALRRWPATTGRVVGAVPRVSRWHARGQGFKSPQLHHRSQGHQAQSIPRIRADGGKLQHSAWRIGHAEGSRSRSWTRSVAEVHRLRHRQPGAAPRVPARG